MKYTSYLTIIVISFLFISCNDEPPVLPGLAKSNITFSTLPDAATITINSRNQAVTPFAYSDLEPGFYKIDIKKDLYLDTTLYFIVKRNITDSVFVELRETPAVWWKTYNVSNSNIPSNSISDIEVDNNNAIWVASRQEGLAKFKDSTFTKYGDANGLTTKVINKLLVDNQNNLWLGTKDGLYRYNGSTFKLYNRENSGFPDNNVISLAMDKSNNLWIGTKDGGLIKFDGVRFYFFNANNSGLPLNDISALYVDKNNALWIGTWGEGLCKFENNTWKYYSLALSNILSPYISSIAEDFDGNIVFGSGTSQSGGGYSILKGNTIKNYSAFNSLIPTAIVTDIKKGKNNIMWICSSGGLVSFRNGVFKLFNTANSGLPGNTVISITVDNNDVKWVGSNGFSWYKGSKL